MPPSLARRMRHAPDGTNGMGVLDLVTLLKSDAPYMNLLFGAGMMLDPIAALQNESDVPAKMGPVLEEHGLEHVVIFTAFLNNRWSLRLVW